MKLLTKLREQQRWSRTELGRRARLHPSRVGQAESGRAILYDVELGRLAVALGYSGEPHDLLSDVATESAS